MDKFKSIGEDKTMSEVNVIKQFEKKGYIVAKTDLKILDKIRNKITDLVREKIKDKKILKLSDDDLLNKLHKFVNKKDINEIRFSIYNKLNFNNEIAEMYYGCAKDYLDQIVGNELAMQKKINLSIQMPKDKDSLLDMHSDIYAGESPFQVVVWIPLVNVSKTKSMFITTPNYNKKMNLDILQKNKKSIKQIYIKNRKKFHFVKVNYGEILIFSPLILHGNTINVSEETRFSLNCRFKSLLSPYDVLVKSHRNIPNFYRPMNIKPMTKIGLNYINNLSQKL